VDTQPHGVRPAWRLGKKIRFVPSVKGEGW
jgi:hypothetical protein